MLLKGEKVLNAKSATIILVVSFLSQVFFGAVVEILRQSSVGENSTFSGLRFLVPILNGCAVVFCGIATVIAAVLIVPKSSIRETSPVGAAWVCGRVEHLAQGAAFGVAIGILMCVLNRVLPHHHIRYVNLDPLDRMAFTSGWARYSWFLLVIIFIPFYEELTYRGVLYAGYRKSFDATPALWLTTGIFVACIFHI